MHITVVHHTYRQGIYQIIVFLGVGVFPLDVWYTVNLLMVSFLWYFCYFWRRENLASSWYKSTIPPHSVIYSILPVYMYSGNTGGMVFISDINMCALCWTKNGLLVCIQTVYLCLCPWIWYSPWLRLRRYGHKHKSIFLYTYRHLKYT